MPMKWMRCDGANRKWPGREDISVQSTSAPNQRPTPTQPLSGSRQPSRSTPEICNLLHISPLPPHLPLPPADEIKHATERHWHGRAANRKAPFPQSPCLLVSRPHRALSALSRARTAALRRTTRLRALHGPPQGPDHSLSHSRRHASHAQAPHACPSRSLLDPSGAHHVPSVAALNRRSWTSGCCRSARHPILAAQQSAWTGITQSPSAPSHSRPSHRSLAILNGPSNIGPCAANASIPVAMPPFTTLANRNQTA
jgi:hypothetical protein